MGKSLLTFALFGVLVLLFLFSPLKTYAATLANASDTITTSRPSASTPLSSDFSVGAGNASVYNNGSIFLASDSAHFWGQTQESLTVATVSAAKTSLFFTNTPANSHANGTVVSTAITAMHTVKFQTQTSIPATGSIVFAFPTSAATDTNQASPSANTFMFNGLSSTNIQSNNATCGSYVFTTTAGGAFLITCNLSAAIAGGITVTFLIGCSSATGATCNTQVPTLINPTKTATAGNADTWGLKINTYDAASGGGNALDNTKVQIGTVESVNVTAHIDQTLSFTISGVADGTNLNSVSICGSSHSSTTSNSGFSSTSTDVNLGTLISTQVNKSIQSLNIQSNAGAGYTITATSSGHLINPANGFILTDAQGTPTSNDTPVPVAFGAGSNKFGIHACDANGKVNTTTWGQNPAKFASPSQSFYYTIVNSTSQPANGGDTIYIMYQASPSTTTAPGDYRTQITYVASSIF